MEQQFITPKFPVLAILGLLAVTFIELIGYAILQEAPAVWGIIIFGMFYLTYTALLRRDVLPLIFATLFFTAYHSLFLNINTNLPIAVLFVIIFAVTSGIMWLLLHYATHLRKEFHMAYTIIAGFLIAQIITVFASTSRDWPFQLEIASYMPTVFSYIFWRFACLSADSVLGWKQFSRVAILVIFLIIAIILGSPNAQV